MHIGSLPGGRREGTDVTSFPDDICCNCGAADGLTVIATDLRRKAFLLIGGFEAKVVVPLPYCAGCKATAIRRRPGVVDAVVWWISWSLLAWIGVMGAIVLLGQQTSRFGLIYGLGAVVVAGLSIVWYRRPARGNRTTNYQPARLTSFDTSRPVDECVAFSNAAYARRVAEAFGAKLPTAHVVQR